MIQIYYMYQYLIAKYITTIKSTVFLDVDLTKRVLPVMSTYTLGRDSLHKTGCFYTDTPTEINIILKFFNEMEIQYQFPTYPGKDSIDDTLHEDQRQSKGELLFQFSIPRLGSGKKNYH